ncbi:MAG: biotin/lipoyl-binding protein [Mariprofundaceae bacterium]|nr:biotin/lipoyl-binding protein [Mariprofundaceae bacterium]
MADGQKIIDDVAKNTTLNPSISHVEQLVQFLKINNLIQVQGAEGVAYLALQKQATHTYWLSWLLKNYLFLRVPLIQPDRFLEHSQRWFHWVYQQWFLYILICFCGVAAYLISRQWDAFLNTFLHFFSMQGFILYGCALFFAKIIHEFGHAYTAKHYGVHVPTMGVALLVMWPVLYTDTSDAWKLPSKKQRMHIGAAGMAAELSLAVIATLLWSITPDGGLRSAFFLLATTTWVMTLFINLNPFMRFDGYYLLSDWWEVENLQQRGFALGKWKLREILFSSHERVPEFFPPRLHRSLILYAWCTWVYRFFLFLGIALLVYFFFFKILGIILMLVELGWFIILPIYNELKEWWKRKAKLNNFSAYRTFALFGLLLLAFVLPWQASIDAPAVWLSQHQTTLYASESAVIKTLAVKEGDMVRKNQRLLTLSSMALDHKLNLLKQKIMLSQWQQETQGVSLELAEESRIVDQEYQGLKQEYQTLQERQEALQLRAGFDGRLMLLNPDIHEGAYIQKNEALALIVSTEKSIIQAYVFEIDISQVKQIDDAIFYPENTDIQPIHLTFISMSQADEARLEAPMLASIYQGDIPVRRSDKGELIPEAAIYKISFSCSNLIAIQHRLRGTVRLKGKRRSYFNRLLDQVLAIFIRESGF